MSDTPGAALSRAQLELLLSDAPHLAICSPAARADIVTRLLPTARRTSTGEWVMPGGRTVLDHVAAMRDADDTKHMFSQQRRQAQGADGGASVVPGVSKEVLAKLSPAELLAVINSGASELPHRLKAKP